MVTVEESIPSKNDNYKAGEDVFYVQFNDISFYIEDEDQENFFFEILKNLFPDLRIEKIFPLGGKKHVINHCQENADDKSKIYIVDKDFDDILELIQELPNLFYLNRYSIENYLLEEESVVQYVIGEFPRLKGIEVRDKLRFDDTIDTVLNNLKRLVILHVVVQTNCLALENVKLKHERFYRFDNGAHTQVEKQFAKYEANITEELKRIDGRLRLTAQRDKACKNLTIDSRDSQISNTPGKYILKMLKQLVEFKFRLPSRNTESFMYRLAEKCHFESLTFLKLEISEYIGD